MKILKQKEYEKMELKGQGRFYRNTEVYDKIAKLEVNEALYILKEEWKGKTKPSSAIASCCHSTKRKKYMASKRAKNLLNKRFSIRQRTDEKGWLVIRIK